MALAGNRWRFFFGDAPQNVRAPGQGYFWPMREKSLRVFLLCALVMALPGLCAHFALGRFALHMALNDFHDRFLDLVFPFVTELANGWVPAILAVALLARDWRSFLMMGLSTGVSAILVQSLKHFVFGGHDRPTMYLEQMPGLKLVAGTDFHHHFSFPSGHSTAAFSMCLALAVIIARKGPAMLLAVFAALLAFSRVYLSQHFTEDILAGAFLGCLTGTAAYVLLYRSKWGSGPALDGSPFRRPRTSSGHRWRP